MAKFNPFRKNAPLAVKLARFAVVIFAVLLVLFSITTQPTCVTAPPSNESVDPARLNAHVARLASDFAPRDYKRLWNLNKCADYIKSEFSLSGGAVSEQTYEIGGNVYRNIIVMFGPETNSRIVVGAHYDGCGDTPGADDNASGVAGLIELAHLLGRTELKQQIELVAYTLGEPPFFRTANMGSARHARRLRENGVGLEGMLCLEMIGYYSDEPNSQRFPSLLLRLFYPDTGNFIGIIGSYGDRALVKKTKTAMKGATDLPVYSMCASRSFPMIDFSDHLNYWNEGYTAAMITDTAYMRNLNYHSSRDLPETLDYDRMANVVVGVYEAVMSMANDGGM
jgi:hypothetical protein